MIRSPKLAAFLCFCALVVGCGNRAAMRGPARHKCLAESAETFEALTEQAHVATKESLNALKDAAATSARNCAEALPVSERVDVDRRLTAIEAGIASDDRSDAALNAVETYRLFVTRQTRNPGDPPLEVSLLDYAGFRYQAAAQSEKPKWVAMRDALQLAHGEWSRLAPAVEDARLKTEFANDMTAMEAAVAAQNRTAALAAAAKELDDVDRLERYFANAARERR